jgi:ribonucleoside-triphosphate reductase
MEEFKASGLLTVYDAGFISLDKQYLTIGINGMVEAAEYLGIEVSNNEKYLDFVSGQLKIIYDLNRSRAKETGYKFNTEFVPAENLGVKNATWDKKDGYEVPRKCYNSYFYRVEDFEINPLEKFELHGERMTRFLDGGSALHLNLDESLTEMQYEKIIQLASIVGCNYFCTNVKSTICNDCEYIDKKTKHSCSRCGSENIDYATRVIGYLKRVTSFGSGRRKEHDRRAYHRIHKRVQPESRISV